MKVILTKTSKLFFLAALMLSLIANTGCNKDDTPKPPVKKYGKIALLHAAFGADSINFFIESKKVNSKMIGYSDSLNYVEILAGEPSIEIKGKDDKSLAKKSIKIDVNASYSLLVTNSTDGKTFESIQVSDDLTAPKENKAKVRFVHLSPDVTKLNLDTTGEAKVFENIAYKSASPYKELDAKKTTFKIVDSESKAVLGTISELDLVKGKIYTIWVSGLKETTDEKKEVKANIFVNK